jgi:AcrR family transcriptional regulator
MIDATKEHARMVDQSLRVASRRGRPNATDAATLQDAAFELFTLQGYGQTSVGEITQLAGVSRNTFFNYFDSKADVFWLQVDVALAALPAELARAPHNLSSVVAIGEAVAACVTDWDAGSVPWILTQFDVIGAPTAVLETGMSRFIDSATLLSSFTADRLGTDARDLVPSVVAATVTAAVVAAARSWAHAGPRRGHLQAYLVQALAPLADGFAVTTDRL